MSVCRHELGGGSDPPTSSLTFIIISTHFLLHNTCTNITIRLSRSIRDSDALKLRPRTRFWYDSTYSRPFAFESGFNDYDYYRLEHRPNFVFKVIFKSTWTNQLQKLLFAYKFDLGSVALRRIDPIRHEPPKSTGVDFFGSTPRSTADTTQLDSWVASAVCIGQWLMNCFITIFHPKCPAKSSNLTDTKPYVRGVYQIALADYHKYCTVYMYIKHYITVD